MSKQSKITVKHYLNTDLKPKLHGLYPTYVRVTFERKNLRFKSVFLSKYYDLEFDFNNESTKRRIDYETKLINFSIDKLQNKNDVSKVLPRLSESILNIVKSEFYTDVAFEFSFYEEFEKELFKIIENTAEINKEALKYIVEINHKTDSNFYKYLKTDLINNVEIRNFIEFVKSILDFVEINYNKTVDLNKYEPNKITLNCFEWKYNNGNEMFLKFIKSNNKNFDKEIKELNELINSYLIYY